MKNLTAYKQELSVPRKLDVDSKQDKITVNGIVQGDGSGNLSAVETINADLLDLNPAAVGLGNVDNVKQYSVENPPPYPVTSVNGQTGAVAIPAMFVINKDPISDALDKTFDEFESAYRAGYVCVICENHANTKKLWTLARFYDEGEFSMALFARQDGGDMSTLEWNYGSTTITDSIDTILYTSLTAGTATNRYYPTSKAVWDAIPHPDKKTDTQTQAVGVDSSGKLWTAPTLSLSDTIPVAPGVASAGTSTEASRANHVHPSDDTKLNVNAPVAHTSFAIDDGDFAIKMNLGQVMTSTYMCPGPMYFIKKRNPADTYGESIMQFIGGTDKNNNYATMVNIPRITEPTLDTMPTTKAYVDGKALPTVTTADDGKFLRVSNGAWAVETVPSAEGVSF